MRNAKGCVIQVITVQERLLRLGNLNVGVALYIVLAVARSHCLYTMVSIVILVGLNNKQIDCGILRSQDAVWRCHANQDIIAWKGKGICVHQAVLGGALA